MNELPSPVLYFEDLKVGDTFESTAHYHLTAEQITSFASEFDPQPFHLDDAAARKTFFAGLAASGWHTAAITMRLLVTGGPNLAGGMLGMGGAIEWNAPTRPGDTLSVRSEVTELSPMRRPSHGVVGLRSRTTNQSGEVVFTVNARLMVLRRLL